MGPKNHCAIEKQHQKAEPWAAGFSLLEMGIVLAIIGLLLGGVLKGREIIELARARKAAQQIQSIKSALEVFRMNYGEFPGSFSKATAALGKNILNGSGSGIEFVGEPLRDGSDGALFWQHLYKANLIPKPDKQTRGGVFCPSSPLGGIYTVAYKEFPHREGLWLILGADYGARGTGGLLTPNRVQALLSALNLRLEDEKDVVIQDGDGVRPGSCIRRNVLSNGSHKACVVYIFLCD